ncbi:amidase [Halomarina rubra]|uniref:Amidase n=1 Tax=Halomarina rubra TaxID=2071873 RepID=A0ABD6ASP0_9EURY|nr:amidase family protein [Halomarina rubra]
MSDDLWRVPAVELVRRIWRGELSPVTLVECCLDRIEARNERTNAFVTVLADEALDRAHEADRAVERGEELGPLHGVPVGIKDLTSVAGVRTTYGSTALAEHVPERDDPAVARLREAGAIVLGKTNTSEFGHLATTDNDLFGSTGNPVDPTKTAGGSSGGSAAAVADGLVPLAQGTDAGGSVRIPASACGIVGIKPSFGRVSRLTRPDAFTDASPFVATGPLARTVGDAALLLDAMAGVDPLDPFSLPTADESFVDATDAAVDGFRVAYSPALGAFAVAEAVRETVEDAADAFADAGMAVERADPDLDGVWEEAREASLVTFQSKMATTVAGSAAAFGVDLGERLDELSGVLPAMVERGREHSAVDLGRANAVRTAVFDAIQALLSEYHLLVAPTLAVPPFERESFGPERIDGERVDRYTGWYLTQPFNMTGHPAASVPAGTVDGLPVGLQIVGRRHRDADVVAAAAAFERQRPWTEHVA